MCVGLGGPTDPCPAFNASLTGLCYSAAVKVFSSTGCLLAKEKFRQSMKTKYLTFTCCSPYLGCSSSPILFSWGLGFDVVTGFDCFLVNGAGFLWIVTYDCGYSG